MREFDVKINTKVDSDELEKAVQNIQTVRDEAGNVIGINFETTVDDAPLEETQEKADGMKNQSLPVDVPVDDDGLDKAKGKEEDLNGFARFGIEVDDAKLNLAMANLSDGISRVKDGMGELKGAIQEVEQAGMQSEQNKAFLEMNLGGEKAKQTYQDISNIVASMPGDDNTMRSVLSTAQALGNDLKPNEMREATKTMADYMSGSATMGKMATESQQDIMKYLLDGNTAELERGSIVSSQVDKLKEANTFMERQKAMQEVLNDLGYGGISTQDTMLNKQAEWEGMLYNSQDALSSMWLGAEKGAMDYILKLNDATGGLVGMGIVATQMVASPLVDVMSGIGQIGTGLKTLKESFSFEGIKKGFDTVKNSIQGVRDAMGTAKEMVDALRNAESLSEGVRSALAVVTGAEAVAEEGGAVAKGSAVAPTTALSVAENSLLLPLLLVIGAIVGLVAILWYLYNNNEMVRNGINNLIAQFQAFIGTVVQVAMQIVSFVQGAIAQVWAWVNGTTNGVNNLVNLVMMILFPFPTMIATILNTVLPTLISITTGWVTSARSKATELVNNVANVLSGIPSRISSAMSGVANAITKPFKDAYDMVAKEVEKIKNKATEVANDPIGALFGGFEGFEGGYEGFDSLNRTIATASTSNNSSVTNNFNINGIIEESASEYIVGAVNNHIKKQNLVRGV